jgi:hypothetical protein
MNVSFDSKYWLYFSRRAGQVMLRQKSTQPAAGMPQKATQKRFISSRFYRDKLFSGEASIELCATVVNSSSFLMGS